MKTMFTLGFASQDFFGSQQARYPALGDTTVDGDKILADISAAQEKMNVINQWVKSHPDYQTLLGSQLSTWNNLQAQIDNNYDVVTTVQQRLSSANPEAWFMQKSEQTEVYYWIAAVNQLNDMVSQNYNLKPGARPAATAPVKAPVKAPVAPSSGPSALVIGAGAIAAVGLLAVLTR